MDKTTKVFALLMALTVGLTCLGMVAKTFIDNNTYSLYEGKQIFYTEQEYYQFKESIAQQGVEIVDMKSVSSIPAVVSFKVQVPNYMQFDYGVKSLPHDIVSQILMSLAGLVFVIGGILFVVLV